MSEVFRTLLYVILAADIVFIVIAGVVFTYLLLVSHLMTFSPPIPTVGKVKRGILKAVAEYIDDKSHAIVMDLGSGWGSLLLPLAKKYPQHLFIGYERAMLPYIISRWRTHNLSNVYIYHQDFFTADFTGVDAIICFQLTAIMQKLLPYMRKHINKNVRVYVNRYPFKDLVPLEKVSFEGDYAVYYVYDVEKE